MFSRTKLCAALAFAFGAPALFGASAQAQTQQVEVTGSRIKRTDAETPSPVDVITRADIGSAAFICPTPLLPPASRLVPPGS